MNVFRLVHSPVSMLVCVFPFWVGCLVAGRCSVPRLWLSAGHFPFLVGMAPVLLVEFPCLPNSQSLLVLFLSQGVYRVEYTYRLLVSLDSVIEVFLSHLSPVHLRC